LRILNLCYSVGGEILYSGIWMSHQTKTDFLFKNIKSIAVSYGFWHFFNLFKKLKFKVKT